MKAHSLCVWFEKNDQQERKESHDVDIHINHWKLRRRLLSISAWKAVANGLKSVLRSISGSEIWSGLGTLIKCDLRYDHFVDIGLLVPDLSNINKICLYLPFKIAVEEILDLGSLFSKDMNLIKAVFNEDYIVHPRQPKILPIEFVKKGRTNIYLLTDKNDIKLEDLFLGTVIEILLAEIQYRRQDPFYFRIRLLSPQIHNFSTVYKPKNSLFESAFTNTEVIDFRINEKRGLDNSLLQRIENNIAAKIKKIHYYLLRNAKDDYVFSHKPLISCRELEDDMWEDYLGSGFRHDKVLAYHWKESESEGEIESFRALIKMKFEKNNFQTILFYIFVASILSIGWNLSASYLFKHLENPSLGQQMQTGPSASPPTGTRTDQPANLPPKKNDEPSAKDAPGGGTKPGGRNAR